MGCRQAHLRCAYLFVGRFLSEQLQVHLVPPRVKPSSLARITLVTTVLLSLGVRLVNGDCTAHTKTDTQDRCTHTDSRAASHPHTYTYPQSAGVVSTRDTR